MSATSIIMGYVFNYFSLKIKDKYGFSSRSVLYCLLALFIFLNSLYFIYPSNINYESTWETPVSLMDENQKFMLSLDLLFVYNYEKIHKNDINTEYHIKTILNNSDPQKSIIIIRDILREDQGFSWRKAMYYLPQYDIYYVMDDEDSQLKSLKTSNNLIISHGKTHKSNGFQNETLQIPLDSSTTQIIWVMNNNTEFFNKLNSKLNITSVTLPNSMKIYFSEINAKNGNLSFLNS
jgi:hypothetical protein